MHAIEIAVRMETDAIKFYTEAAGKTSHPVGRKMFLVIAEDEKRHLEILSKILKGLDIHLSDVSPMENLKTIFESMKPEMMERITTTKDEMEAFKIAMEMEKKGIEFYESLLKNVKTDKETALFKRLIEEEQQHFSIFSNTYSFLQDTGNWFLWEERGIVDGGTPYA
ncbi:MAG: ferritin family protein [Thermodesulfovibrionales bacterium]|nr:ferritin family protein [Thermodesulfovibrionales bacterium]